MVKRILFISLVAALILAGTVLATMLNTRALNATGLPSSADRMAGFPKVILWAWERHEDLSFIDPREVGIAFLAKTLYLRNERVSVRPRLQPFSYQEGTTLIAVVRIETDRLNPAALSPEQREKAASEITALADSRNVAAIQIDFDATVSERDFYRGLLFDLRKRLPGHVRLSITALASWCIADDWLSGLPIDEAVPMLFRLGADHHQVIRHLQSGGGFRPRMSQHSLGISTDEPIQDLPSGRRVYIFCPRAWSEQTAQKIIDEVNQCQ